MEINKENFFLKGDTVHLRALAKKDITGNYRYWLNNSEVVKYNSHGRFPATVESLEDFVANSYNSRNSLVLAVCMNDTTSHVGNISLQAISWIDRNAEIAFLLGELSFHGKGIMYEAGQLLIHHAFLSLNLHRIYCGTSSENTGMQKLALKLGMEQEGVRKEAIFNSGRYHDIIEYGILNKAEHSV